MKDVGSVHRVFKVTRQRQKEKFCTLISRTNNNRPTLDKSKLVVNLSKKELTQAEEEALSLGLNYAVAPSKVPTTDIIAATEATARQLDSNAAQKLREGVARIISRAKLPKSNLSQLQQRALKSLKKDESIVIVPADKGNATVVMDRSQYSEKMHHLLEDKNTYQRISRNPTTQVEKQVVAAVKDLRKEEYINDPILKRLSPQHSYPPQLYGLPKIHKDSVPMRPIVAAINSPTYALAKEVARIVSPLVGKTSSFVKNSAEFVQMMRQMKVDSEDILVSFDVVNLFTNILIDEALQVMTELLRSNTSLANRTPIPVETICNLAKLCLKSTSFQFENRFYRHRRGAAMGSPLSPIIANLFMEHFKNIAMQSSHL